LKQNCISIHIYIYQQQKTILDWLFELFETQKLIEGQEEKYKSFTFVGRC